MSDATCYLCGETYTTRGIGRHLPSCIESSDPSASEEAEHLSISPVRGSRYRLEVAKQSGTSLDDIDRFLRAIWVECCGHLHSFDREAHDELTYRYDFGSTTSLRIRIQGKLSATYGVSPPGHDGIYVMARNKPPEITCSHCARQATTLCADHLYGEDPEGVLCDDCAEEHPCEEYLYSPIVNSPRTGVCGFTGAALTDWYPAV